MKRSSSFLERTGGSTATRAEYPPGHEANALAANEKTGLAHLLVNHTVDQIMHLPAFVNVQAALEAFLQKGIMPATTDVAIEFQRLMLNLDEPELNLAMLTMTDAQVVIDRPELAENLLKALELDPKRLFFNIKLVIALQPFIAVQKLLQLVTAAIRLDNGINMVEIYFQQHENYELEKLFDALATVDSLQLKIQGPAIMHPCDLVHLNTLISKNKTIRALVLPGLPRFTDSGKMVWWYRSLLQSLRNLTHLKDCILPPITEELQEALGDFLGGSHSLTSLAIAMKTTVSTPGLISGLAKNRSLRNLAVDVGSITQGMLTEDSILPLISLIEEDRTCITTFTLIMYRCPPNMILSQLRAQQLESENGSVIDNLIANNSTLHTLNLMFPGVATFDLSTIGDGLKKNTSLETLRLEFTNDSNDDSRNSCCPEPGAFLEFFEKLAKNHTLTTMTAQYAGRPEANVFPDDQREKLNQILNRNLYLRQYLCSNAYVEGAASGFLHALGLPTDPAIVIAKHLIKQTPLIANRALALINRDSNERAIAWRRSQNTSDWKQVISNPESDRPASYDAIENLLANIATTGRDFSDEDLRSISVTEHLEEVLFRWMEAMPDFYIYLARRFSEALGAGIMKKRLVDFMNKDGVRVREQHLLMLEKSFKPDQGHLAGIVDHELDYDSIDSKNVKFFVGYNVVLYKGMGNEDMVINWCSQNQQPELCLAILENFTEHWANLPKLPPDFLQKLVSKLHLFPKVKSVTIEEMAPEIVGQIALSLLSNSLGLERVALFNVQCTKQDFTLIMNKLAENRSMENFVLYFCNKQETFSMLETIVATLEANLVLEKLTVCLPHGCGETDVRMLVHLAANHPRLGLEMEEADDSDSDREETSDEGNEFVEL